MSACIIVVDTNVWLDYLLGNRMLHDEAKSFILGALERKVALVIPPHSMNDIFFIVQQQLKAANRKDGKLAPEIAAECARRSAWACLDAIMEFATVGPSDQSDAWIASKQRRLHPDYEDNLVVACAQRLNARLLVTSDKALIEHAPVAAMTPGNALELLAAECD